MNFDVIICRLKSVSLSTVPAGDVCETRLEFMLGSNAILLFSRHIRISALATRVRPTVERSTLATGKRLWCRYLLPVTAIMPYPGRYELFALAVFLVQYKRMTYPGLPCLLRRSPEVYGSSEIGVQRSESTRGTSFCRLKTNETNETGYWRASRQGFSGKHRWEFRKPALRLGNRPEELRWEKEPHVEKTMQEVPHVSIPTESSLYLRWKGSRLARLTERTVFQEQLRQLLMDESPQIDVHPEANHWPEQDSSKAREWWSFGPNVTASYYEGQERLIVLVVFLAGVLQDKTVPDLMPWILSSAIPLSFYFVLLSVSRIQILRCVDEDIDVRVSIGGWPHWWARRIARRTGPPYANVVSQELTIALTMRFESKATKDSVEGEETTSLPNFPATIEQRDNIDENLPTSFSSSLPELAKRRTTMLTATYITPSKTRL
ncbi:uncharacterized protein ARMOST_00122 [Armillaria ostoyae]|uniref:Uncharacterized protein n=1 Tax=Armillaria ostoyae TaxID=47428 RepID=A0A284QK85_ARMOS|nr:uncharacterized protein ARMOST_00122 [Armillaria ostoyae]